MHVSNSWLWLVEGHELEIEVVHISRNGDENMNRGTRRSGSIASRNSQLAVDFGRYDGVKVKGVASSYAYISQCSLPKLLG